MFFFPKGPLYFWCSFLSRALRYDQLTAYEKNAAILQKNHLKFMNRLLSLSLSCQMPIG